LTGNSRFSLPDGGYSKQFSREQIRRESFFLDAGVEFSINGFTQEPISPGVSVCAALVAFKVEPRNWTLNHRRYNMPTYDIAVFDGSQEIATGVLTVNTSTNPMTGTFTPTDGTAVTCTIGSWGSSANAATTFSFTLTATNGDFPVPPNNASYTYSFVGHENNTGSDPSGHVNWPQNLLKNEGGDPPTWQGEATVDPKAAGQGAY